MPNKTIEKKGENWRKGYQVGFQAGRLQGLNEALGVCPEWYREETKNSEWDEALSTYRDKIKSLIDKNRVWNL